MRRSGMATRGLAVFVLLTLSGCIGGFYGESERKSKLLGERISVMALARALTPDVQLAGMVVNLPRPVLNADWPQPGGNADHVMQHPAFGDLPKKLWSVDIGAGATDDAALLASPVLQDSRIFTLDSEGTLAAFDANTGARFWRLNTRSPDEDDVVFSGAITTGAGMVFAATGVGQVIAASMETGKELWRVDAPGPIRGAPTYSDGRLFMTTIDNKAVAFSVKSGERLWTHSGIVEIAALLGGASPAVRDNVVIVPYSSGEIFALKAETGRVFWMDSLSDVQRTNAISNLADIRGNPVIDRDIVIAMSHSGRVTALDFKTGVRVWDRRIGGINTPWVAGDFVFLLSNAAEVIALTRRDGRVRWLTQLPQFKDPEQRQTGIQYTGPVLAGDRLVVSSSLGELHAISPYTGQVLGNIDVKAPVFIPPIVAGATIYVLTDKGRLIAYR
jgi:outer membrane protein assembly factor BamB